MIDIDLLQRAVYESRDGISISDAILPDCPLIFVNPAFERITGYSQQEVIGRNCRFLQGILRDQPALEILREALRRGEPCIVTLQNFRKDGSFFWNELSMSPIHDATGRLTHFLGIQRDVSSDKLVEYALREEKDQLQQTRHRLEHESLTDTLTGLNNRRYLEKHMPDLLSRMIDERRPITVLLMDIDYFKKLNDTAGHAAGDQALQRIGECLKQSRRQSTDMMVRYGGEEFAMACYGLDSEQAGALAQRLVDRIRRLEIPNPGTQQGRVTISVGYVSAVPSDDMKIAALFQAADKALYDAKQAGRDRVSVGML